jgi:heme oxygenase (biliverdin-IX-beta and delta-forming)
LSCEPTRPIRDILRHATAEHHAAVDRRFAPLIAQGMSGYVEFLLASAAAVIPLERALTARGVDRILPRWQARTREAALREDLEALDALDTLCAARRVGDATPDIGGEAHQFGVLYVLEGSRLGGRILARDVQAHPDARVRGATRYLRHGENDRLWQSFLSALEASEPTRRAVCDAIAGAQAAFAMFAAPRMFAASRMRPSGGVSAGAS